ncbi:MAG: DEAD/DEAH box helicase family protein [Gemmataceae bacterium]|nr:DEAD/DEAH box helicase family protein [Gemmataceae bacterium]
MSAETVHLSCQEATVVLAGAPDLLASLPGVRIDPRTETHRAEGRDYRAIVEALRERGVPYEDKARAWQPTPWPLRVSRDPFPHQREAVDTWWRTGGRGVVVLPTGTGKTFVAMLAIAKLGRPALVVTPTIDLMSQWYRELGVAFDVPVGLLGGGYHDIRPLTVTTYDSAHIHLERWADKFALVVFDEVHHLPSASYSMAAIGALAPYRLGLTATPERADGQEARLEELVGPLVYRREITELTGQFLANYRIERLYVELSDEEAMAYQMAREHYKQFCSMKGIGLGGANGWQRFIQETSRTTEGRAAFLAFQEQRRIALAAPAKLHLLERLLDIHAKDRVLVFTYDNATVYEISRRFLVPAITHQTKAKERKHILDGFLTGEYNCVVTSRVLNEGVDVPAANVGVVLSGTSTVAEHVQRLGRLLRKHGDKEATLIEVVTRGTVEEFASQRRRQHQAYQ